MLSINLLQAFHDSRKYPQGVRSPQTKPQVAQVSGSRCITNAKPYPNLYSKAANTSTGSASKW